MSLLNFHRFACATLILAADHLPLGAETVGDAARLSAGAVPSAVQPVGSAANIAVFRAVDVSGFALGQTMLVAGYHAATDGGGGTFLYDPVSKAADNGATVIAPGAGPGRWLLQLLDRINVKQFGAYGDWNGKTGHDDTAALQAAIDFGSSHGWGVLFPPGQYLISAPLVCRPPGLGGVTLEGTRYTQTYTSTVPTAIVCNPASNWSGRAALTLSSTRNVLIKDLSFYGPYGATNVGRFGSGSSGIYHGPACSVTKIENCFISGFETGLLIGDAAADANADQIGVYDTNINDCEFGAWARGSQTYIVSFFNCQVAARIPYLNQQNPGGNHQVPPGFNIFGGQASMEGRNALKEQEATVTDVSAGVVTVTTTGSALSDFNAVYGQLNAWLFIAGSGKAFAPGVTPITYGYCGAIGGVAGNQLSVGSYSGATPGAAAVGQKCVIFRPNVVFFLNYGQVEGVHVEGGYGGPMYLKPIMFIKAGQQGRLTLSQIHQSLPASNTLLDALLPFGIAAGDNLNACGVTLRDNSFSSNYPKFIVNAPDVVLEGNHWVCKPVILNNSGSFGYDWPVMRDEHYRMDYAGLATLQDNAYREIKSDAASFGANVLQPIYRRSNLYQAAHAPLPSAGFQGEVLAMTADDAGPPAYSQLIQTGTATPNRDGAYYSTTPIAATATASAGSSVITVSDATGLFCGREISLAGAGPAGGPWVGTILEAVKIADPAYGNNAIIVTLNRKIDTSVAGAKIDPVAPTFLPYGAAVSSPGP